MSHFVIWDHAFVKTAARVELEEPDPKQRVLERALYKGATVGAVTPGAHLAIGRPPWENKLLLDSLHNSDHLIAASQKLVDLLRELAVPELEVLPMPVHNHKGKPIAAPYYLVNPTPPLECIDGEKSKATPGRVNKNNLQVETLVLDESKVPAERTLFRLARLPGPIVVHRDLAAKLDAAGITGTRWSELKELSS
jgi:hypothetical protein